MIKVVNKLRTYVVSIYVDDMMYPEVAELEIKALTEQEAIKWVKDNMRIGVV